MAEYVWENGPQRAVWTLPQVGSQSQISCKMQVLSFPWVSYFFSSKSSRVYIYILPNITNSYWHPFPSSGWSSRCHKSTVVVDFSWSNLKSDWFSRDAITWTAYMYVVWILQRLLRTNIDIFIQYYIESFI